MLNSEYVSAVPLVAHSGDDRGSAVQGGRPMLTAAAPTSPLVRSSGKVGQVGFVAEPRAGGGKGIAFFGCRTIPDAGGLVPRGGLRPMQQARPSW